MTAYQLQSKLFMKSTGVEYNSEKGRHFRYLAKQCLEKFLVDMVEENLSLVNSAHRLKGIASTCGVLEVENICQKIERYSCLVNQKAARNKLVDMAIAMICIIDI
ncbi:Hpt domain-containing protein [Vibrio jasicida]|uniref:Hpt domain-containing protein n=1 Tax=Vibrio jasicida TaxID=766224 RepID=UPI0005770DAC|nr:Hpt domain-containing protein [Vibrio jasicida]